MAELDISTKNCIVEQEGNVLIVTLNRPEAKNAFSPEMLLGMYKAWRLLDEADDLHCAILTANGDTFCAGMDLKAGADGEHRSTEEFMELMGKVPNIHWQALLRDNRPNKPLILAVEGYALAGGTEILQGTDIRVAAENAIFGVTKSCQRAERWRQPGNMRLRFAPMARWQCARSRDRCASTRSVCRKRPQCWPLTNWRPRCSHPTMPKRACGLSRRNGRRISPGPDAFPGGGCVTRPVIPRIITPLVSRRMKTHVRPVRNI